MELFKNIRLGIGQRLLRKKVCNTRRKVAYTNLDSVRKIGIVWDASQTNDFTCLSKFYQKMQERNIDVSIIGYFGGKHLPNQYTAIRYLRCIKKEEVSYFYLPDSYDARAFIDNRFDVLIDLNFKNLLPLKYLSSLSNAALKVGLYDPEKSDTVFDLMMELKKPVEVENYLTQTLLYLEMINSPGINN
ncbi:MAG TPA: hypothetical protein VHO68_02515 [Bacteroidales bacterium]|nr:hypothetical protein [Bacteroidales bacterium]